MYHLHALNDFSVPKLVRSLVFLAALLLTLSVQLLQAQISPAINDSAVSDPQNEIAITSEAQDSDIADRLTRILVASEWFESVAVSVREGIVFLDGQTGTDERKDWARQLAIRTQGVVAVVNRLEVQPEVSWDLTPTWLEIQRLSNQVQWIAPLLAVSLLILLLAWLMSRGVAALARHSLRDRITSPLLLQIVARALSIPIILIGLYLVLQIAGLTRLAITVLGGTGLVGIVLGLAFREIAANALASILLSIRNPFRAGDWIRVGDHQGIVQNLNMRTTVLLSLDGNHIQIPNALVYNSIIENFSTNPNRRADFVVGIGYNGSVDLAQDVIYKVLRKHPAVLDDPEPGALLDELGPSSINIRVQFWFDGKAYSMFKIRSALMRQVKRALQDAGIARSDPAPEVIYLDGETAPRDAATRVSGNQHQMAEVEQHRPTAENADAVAVTPGEGDLLSEKGDLERQADVSDMSKIGVNLLDPETDKRKTEQPGRA